jgi:hypothetical protein
MLFLITRPVIIAGWAVAEQHDSDWPASRLSFCAAPLLGYNGSMDEAHVTSRTVDLTGWDVAAILGAVVVIVFVALILWFSRKP